MDGMANKTCKCGHPASTHPGYDGCGLCNCSRFEARGRGRAALPEDQRLARMMIRVRPDQKAKLKGKKGQGKLFRAFIDTLGIGLIVLATGSAQAAGMNPDGYIGGLTVSLDGSYAPRQSWALSQGRYVHASDPSYYDARDRSDSFNTFWAYGADLNLLYPVSAGLTLGFGGSWSQQFLNTANDYVEYYQTGPKAPPAVTFAGNSSWDDNHGVYTVKAHLIYHFGGR